MFEYSTDPSIVTLIVDLHVCGVWQPQVDVLFHACIVDIDAYSHCHHSTRAMLCCLAQAEKT